MKILTIFGSDLTERWIGWATILDDKNFNLYAPTLTGTGASGSWGISITGTAEKAIADASGNTITSTYAPLTSPALTGTPTAPTAADGTNTTQIATTAFVMSQFKYNDAMIYKGVVNANSDLPATHYQGWTYKVATAGEYAGINCEIGDMIICNTDGTSVDATHWNVIQTNIDGAVISSSTNSTDNAIAIWDSTSGRIIKNQSAITYIPATNAELGSTKGKVAGLFITGTTYGDTAANLGSNAINVFKYGDPGPQIRFGSSTSAGELGAIIWSDNSGSNNLDQAFYFVGRTNTSNAEANVGIVTKTIVARTRLTIGQSYNNTSYALYINGSTGMNGTLTINNNINVNATNKGLYLTDGASTSYAGIYDNGANLWIGATSSTGNHHKGNVYISTGYGSDGVTGNKYGLISIPTNTDGTITHTSRIIATMEINGTAGNSNKPAYIDSYGYLTTGLPVFVQNSTVINSSTDWNTLMTPGCYTVNISAWGDAATYHSPNETQSNLYSFGLLFVVRGNENDAEKRTLQIYFPHQATKENPIYCRMANGSSPSWQAWHRLTLGTFDTSVLTSGILTTTRGGTGVNSHTSNRLVWSTSATTIQGGYHYANTTKVAINSTSEPTENFYVNGTSSLNGNVTIGGSLIKFTGLGEGLELSQDANYFGTNYDARIISIVDTNPGTGSSAVDGGLIVQAVGRVSSTDTIQELLRIRNHYGISTWKSGEFQWKTKDIVVEVGKANKTWDISIDGNATTATSSKALANYYSSRQTNANIAHVNNGGVIHFKATQTMTSNKPMGDGNILHFHWDNDSGWDSQLYIPDGASAHMQWRAHVDASNWQTGWTTLIDSKGGRITDTTASTSTSTGALIISGGIATGAASYLTGSVHIVGNAANDPLIVRGISGCQGTTGDRGSTTDPTEQGLYLNYNGGPVIVGYDNNNTNNKFNIQYTQDASSTSTGALVVAGGAGIAKKLYVGNNIITAGLVYSWKATPAFVLADVNSTRTDSSFRLNLTISDTGRQGLWSSAYSNNTKTSITAEQKWLIYRDNDGKVYVPGNADTATKIAITTAAPTSSKIVGYIPFSTAITGNNDLYAQDSLYLYDTVTNSAISATYLNVGKKGTIQGGLTLHSTAAYLGNLVPATLGADRTWTLPDATGTIALTSSNVTSADSAKWLMNRGTNVTVSDSTWAHGVIGAGGTNTSGGTVWKQNWKQSGLTWNNNGTSTTLNDSGDIVIWLSQSSNANSLWANLAIDGYIYSLSGFRGGGASNISINSATANSAIMTVKNTATGTNGNFYWGYSHLMPNLVTGGNLSGLSVGTAASDNNSAYFGWHHEGSSSANNYISIGTYGHNHLIKVYKTGNTVISGTTTSTKFIGPLEGNADTATSISGQTPTLAASTESNEIVVKDLGNTAPESGKAQRKGIDFRWYDSHWMIGNLRTGSRPSAGFGFSYSADGTTYSNLVIISNEGKISAANGFEGDLTGNAASATGIIDAGNSSHTITIRYNGEGAAATDWIPMHDTSGNLVPVNSTNLANKIREKASGSWGISITGSSASCTGNATTASTASKLSNTSAIGSDVKPVYFTNGGIPQETATEFVRAFTTADAGTDLNTMVNSGIYSITGGTLSNYPTGGSKYATILTAAYRKPSGNSLPDYAWQIGNFTQDSDRMWYRTSQSSTWRAWRQIVNIATNTAVGNSTTPVYIDANGAVQSCTAYSSASVNYATSAGSATTASNVTQSSSTADLARPIWFCYQENNSYILGRAGYNTNFMYNPGTKTITIGSGSLSETEYSGNAATATSASKISAKLATTTKTYLLGTATTITATAAKVEVTGDTGVYLTTTAGELSAVRHSWNVSGTEKAYTTYNSTDDSIDFVFI